MTTHTHLRPTEATIVGNLVAALLEHGASISVGDGEEIVLRASVSLPDILAEVGHTDETHLYAHFSGKEGWIHLVHGNDEDVVTDCTINLSDIVERAMT